MDARTQAIKRAAERGDRDAQFDLACAYLRGEGVRKNRVLCLKWMILAGDQGDTDADLQCQLIGSELSEMQERRAVAGALRWKFRHQLRAILAELLKPGTLISINDQDNLPTFVKLPPRLH